jgi:hypothetical protein
LFSGRKTIRNGVQEKWSEKPLCLIPRAEACCDEQPLHSPTSQGVHNCIQRIPHFAISSAHTYEPANTSTVARLRRRVSRIAANACYQTLFCVASLFSGSLDAKEGSSGVPCHETDASVSLDSIIGGSGCTFHRGWLYHARYGPRVGPDIGHM